MCLINIACLLVFEALGQCAWCLVCLRCTFNNYGLLVCPLSPEFMDTWLLVDTYMYALRLLAKDVNLVKFLFHRVEHK